MTHEELAEWAKKLQALLPEGYLVTSVLHNYLRSYSLALWPPGTNPEQSSEYLMEHSPPPVAYQFGWIGHDDGYEGTQVDDKAIREIARQEWERAR